jgi:hypothetical protein
MIKRNITTTVLSGMLLLGGVSCSKDSGGGEGPDPDPTPVVATPGKATLVSPANNKTCEQVNGAGEVFFSWEESTDTDSYDLKIVNLNTQGVTNRNNIEATGKGVSLLKGVPYSWQIISKNSGTKITFSDTWKFYLAGDGVANYAPFPAVFESPAPGSTVQPVDGKITISWEGSDPDEDNLTYTLYIDTVDGQQETADELKDMSASSTEVIVEAGAIYYWRVVTSDGVNTSSSITYTFRVG